MALFLTLKTKKKLRDEEGKKLGLKASGKGSASKDNDVKMSEAEVTNYITQLTKPYTTAHTTFESAYVML